VTPGEKLAVIIRTIITLVALIVVVTYMVTHKKDL
jgi:hypothetical protein